MLPKVAVLSQNALHVFYALEESILYLRKWYCIKLMGPNWLLHYDDSSGFIGVMTNTERRG